MIVFQVTEMMLKPLFSLLCSSCQQIHPPTGVTHCVSAFLTHCPSAYPLPNLVVAKSTLLEIYHVRSAYGLKSTPTDVLPGYRSCALSCMVLHTCLHENEHSVHACTSMVVCTDSCTESMHGAVSFNVHVVLDTIEYGMQHLL